VTLSPVYTLGALALSLSPVYTPVNSLPPLVPSTLVATFVALSPVYTPESRDISKRYVITYGVWRGGLSLPWLLGILGARPLVPCTFSAFSARCIMLCYYYYAMLLLLCYATTTMLCYYYYAMLLLLCYATTTMLY